MCIRDSNYGATISDLNNCSIVENYFVDEILSFPQITGNTLPATCGNNNGAVDINITPLNGNSFSWSNGSTNEDLANLSSGNYTVTVTALNGCNATQTFTVNNQGSIFTMTALMPVSYTHL